jgi:hypothetical protein
VFGEEKVTYIVFGGVASEAKWLSHLKVELKSVHGEKQFSLEALDKDKICGKLPRVHRGSWMEKLREEHIFINDVGDDCPSLDVLIGAEDLAKIMKGRIRVYKDGLIASETIFGWALMRSSPTNEEKGSKGSALTVTGIQTSEASVEHL